MVMLNKTARFTAIISVVGLVVIFLGTQPVTAQNYESGTYGACNYSNSSCAAAKPQTEITLPGGLQVLINLRDNQVIPYTGYKVVVTPLTTDTSALGRVEFYINGMFVRSVEPQPSGEVHWQWQPAAAGDTTLRVVSYAKDGAKTETTFKLIVVEEPLAVAEQDNGLFGGLLTFVRSLPEPIIYSFPYLLFILLVVNAVVLFIQTRREVKEITALQAVITREHALAAEKNGFIALASHYLRTPLTIIEGGVDLLKTKGSIPANTSAQAQVILTSLHDKVEALLTQTQNASKRSPSLEPERQLPTPHLWNSPGLYVPILLIGLLLLVFNLLVAYAGTFSINQINLLVQAVTFVLLALIFYQIWRRLQLRRRDRQRALSLLQQEQAISEARDQLVDASTAILNQEIQRLSIVTDQLPQADTTTQLIKGGEKRFRSVLTKFAVAAQLKSGKSNAPYSAVYLSELVQPVLPPITENARAKNITIKPPADVELAMQSPNLLRFVIGSLLDNAVFYSKKGGVVDMRTTSTPTEITLTITDHGDGIAPEKLTYLFQPFSQLENVERFSHEGMGFSLYLDRLILRYLGGNIDISSRPGTGTTAVITLPSGAVYN